MTNETNYKNKAWWLIATWFGSGLAPKASGTFGTIAALPFAFVIQYYLGNTALFIASIIMFFVGWWASNEYMKFFPEKHDPKQIVVDEVVGVWLVISSLSDDDFIMIFPIYFIAFIFFRFFDILKPFPISVADRKIKGGFGVMFDDVLAAIYAYLLAWSFWLFYLCYYYHCNNFINDY